MMATEWPSRASRVPSSLPTRPQPTTITCMGMTVAQIRGDQRPDGVMTGAKPCETGRVMTTETDVTLTSPESPATAPKPLPPAVDVEESLSYRIKTRLL